MEAIMKDRTKYLYAEHLTEMLKEKTFDKIRVTELVKRSGTTPPTFYYHFKDKYELVAWMYLRDFSDVVGYEEAEYSPERLARIMQKMEGKRAFYKKVFASDSQNSIANYIHNLALALAKDALQQAGAEKLTEEQELAIAYHNYGIQGLLREWVLSDKPVNTMTLATLMYHKTPDFLKESFAQVAYEPEELMENKL
ncbi:MAG: TetR/AcrR family transcriptional regulator C-terminal domain-containing protein [Lachnospiraceae bacterium]|nr:TetR/AcrR family transcriptional regulator C-terminal domain-containing protein [Lachnospiraceae bacterium]